MIGKDCIHATLDLKAVKPRFTILSKLKLRTLTYVLHASHLATLELDDMA